jgi:hypothetical protein
LILTASLLPLVSLGFLIWLPNENKIGFKGVEALHAKSNEDQKDLTPVVNISNEVLLSENN